MENLKIYDLTVNYLKNPCGIDTVPRFSFKAQSGIRGDKLAEFTVTVSANPDFSSPVWQRHFGSEDGSVLIRYEGEALSPVTRYYFSVEAKSAAGAEGKNESGTFVTGKLSERWSGKWITANFIRKEDSAFAAPYLRKTFDISAPVKEAYLTICGLGYFESYINGEKTGDDMLSPAFTRYDATDMYMVYDVKRLLTVGKNALSAVLGNGWYNCFAEDPWNTRAASWRHWPKLI